MGVSTGIAWTRSTRNFWSGCTKVGPGCDGCYAEAFNRWTRGVNPLTREAKNWGPGAPRIPHLVGAVKDLRAWNRIAGEERDQNKLLTKEMWILPGFWPVFINSQSDLFDNEVPQAWRDIAFAAIEASTNLTFILVTKRIGNVADMVPSHWILNGFPPNVWLLITVVNQAEIDRDAPKLFALPSVRTVGFSIEPMIGEIDIAPWMLQAKRLWGANPLRQKLWVIVGGESRQAGHAPRPFVLGWAKRLARECAESGASFFMKQAGDYPTNREGERCPHIKGHGENPEEWPHEIRLQQFPL